MRRLFIHRGIAHLRAHAVAYAALFFAITGTATAVTGIQRASQDNSEARVLANPQTVVRMGTQEILLLANRLKVTGVCKPDSAELRIGVVQESGKPLRGAMVHALSRTLGYQEERGSSPMTIGSAPPGQPVGDRGDFNAYTSDPRGSLDGSFFVRHLNDGCAFQASAIAG